MNNFTEMDIALAEDMGGMAYIDGDDKSDNPYDEIEEYELYLAWHHGYKLEENFYTKKEINVNMILNLKEKNNGTSKE